MQRNYYEMLPPELWGLIIKFASLNSLAVLDMVNKQFKVLVDSHIVAEKGAEKEPVTFRALGERKKALRPLEQEFVTLQLTPTISKLEKFSNTINFLSGPTNPTGFFMKPLTFFLPPPVNEDQKFQEKVEKLHVLAGQLTEEEIVLIKRPC